MRKRISALLLVLAMVVTSFLSPLTVEAAYGKVSSYKDYKVYTPAGYNRFDESRQYPVIYVMPENGYKMDNSGLVKKLQSAMKNGECTQMIIVTPEFSKWTDIHAAMESLVEKIDARYNTLEGAEYRAVVGTGVGGYLAYIAGITEKYVEPEEVPPVEEEPADDTIVEDEVVEDEVVEDEVVEDEVVEEVVEEEAAPAEEVVEEVVAPAEEVVEEEIAPAEEVVEEEAAPAETPEYVAADAPNLFKYVASIRGNFVGKGNYWLAKYGEVYDYMEEMGAEKLANFYTYIDSPVDDAWADMEGSTNDIGQLIINNGTDENACEYTVRPGAFTNGFFTESVNRVAKRLTDGMLADAISGTVALKNTILPSEASTFEVDYTVETTEEIKDFSANTETMDITVEVLDPSTNEVLASNSTTEEGAESVSGTLVLDKNVQGTSATVVLSVKILGAEFELATAKALNVRETVVDGDYQLIDLMGDWNFNYVYRGMYGDGPQGYDAVKEDIEAGTYKDWSVVQPGLGWWDEGFGNVKKEVLWGYDAYFGEGWYVRTFDIPSNFNADDAIISVGNLDDRGQVFINGILVGETGMVDGVSNNESTWEVYSYFDIDPSVLNVGGTNTIVVRCYNDGFGGGGWYSGPIAIYSKAAFEADESTISYFEEYEFDSKYAASALGSEEETVKNKYLIALPESYDENPDKYYPTVYLMHQYNSTHKSYITDSIDRLMRNAAAEGLVDEMIIVVPNSQEESWWRGDWMKMVSEELVPLIDSTYRTIDDARYRFTAGCSMGGQGAFGVALQNPDLFSGAVSFFGAFSMGGDASPNVIVEEETKEYIDSFSMYFICGNQDGYKFGDPAIELHQQLLAKDIDHKFFIENGEHDSPFYVPYFVDAMSYTRDNMYHSDGTVGDYLAADAAIDAEAGKVTVSFEALDGIENYYNNIPDSSYTEDNTPALSVPLKVEVEQDGKVVLCEVVRDNFVEDGKLAGEFTFDLPEGFDAEAEYTVTVKASVFDGVYELYSKTNAPEVDDPEVDDPEVDDPDVDDPDDDDKPGTDKPEKPESSNPVINIMTKMVKTWVNIFKGFLGKFWK